MVRLEKGLIVLEVIIGIAPLLGLIGAVSGLVHVFSHLGLSSGASDTRQIALGIAEALNATVFGLSIAVPTLIGFSYFSRKVEVMSVEMETLVVELINKCYYGRSSREFEPAKAAPVGSVSIPTPVAGDAQRTSRYELRGAKTASAPHYHRLARRYSHHPADLFCRLHDLQEGSTGSSN
jgi:biopolymer transport protein ExbB